MGRLVAFPSAVARITSLSLTPFVPGQIVHEIQSSGARKVLSRGPGHFTGVVEFGSLDTVADANRFEAFLASLNGSENFFDLPLNAIKQPSSATATITGSTSRLEYTVSNHALFQQEGSYWEALDRLLIITDASPTRVRFWPEIDLPNGTTIRDATKIRVRALGAPSMPHTPHWQGPWSLQIAEVV